MTEKPKNKLPKDMATALDCAIRDSKKSMVDYESGYIVSDSQYFNYMSNDVWKSYLNSMPTNHKEQYGMGAGGELKAGKYPPKMASFGSSSRFIYEESKQIDDFIFEEKLDTRVGGIANLDGFLRRGGKYIYVEAKRREIYYPSHEREEIKCVYIPVYKEISKICGEGRFRFESNNAKDENVKKITFYVNNTPVQYFDLKQLICHFLGITYDIAKHSIKEAEVKFLYLLYNPTKKIEEYIDKNYVNDIKTRYNNVTDFITANKDVFKSIFYAVLKYQVDTQKLDMPNIDFEFNLVDQDTYLGELK